MGKEQEWSLSMFSDRARASSAPTPLKRSQDASVKSYWQLEKPIELAEGQDAAVFILADKTQDEDKAGSSGTSLRVFDIDENSVREAVEGYDYAYVLRVGLATLTK